MGRPLGVDTWCAQKHIMTAEGHLEEVLTKLYREAPDSEQIGLFQNKVRDLMKLRETVVDNLGSLSKHELGFEKDCDRCVDDFSIKLDDDEVDDSVKPTRSLLSDKRGSFGGVTQLLNINDPTSDDMNNKAMMNGAKDMAVVNLAHAGGALAGVVGQKLDLSGKMFLNKKPSFWLNVIGGLTLQVVGVASKSEAAKIIGLVGGATMLGNAYRPYLEVKSQAVNYTPRSSALAVYPQEATEKLSKEQIENKNLVQVD